MKKIITGFILFTMGFAGGAESLTIEQILNSAYDSTGKTLRLSLATTNPITYSVLTDEVAWSSILTHETTGTPGTGIGVGLKFIQETSASNDETVAGIAAKMTDVTGASEDASLIFYTMTAGAAMTEKMALETLAMVVNETSLDYDFRVESNGNANAIFVDAGNDRVGIFTAAPTVPFEVTGNALITGTFQVTSTSIWGGNLTLQNAGVIDNATNGTVKIDEPSSATTTPVNILTIAHSTSGTAGTGIGTGAAFQAEDDGGTQAVGMSVQMIATDSTSGSEDYDFVVNLMDAGSAAAERFRVDSDGLVTLRNAATIDNTTNGTLALAEPAIYLNGAIKTKTCTIADGDATPDVSGCTVLTTSANTGATEITDLDNPVVGAIYIIIGGSATNSSTITDGGNFALSAGFTASVDETLTLFVQADNDYIELTRSTN